MDSTTNPAADPIEANLSEIERLVAKTRRLRAREGKLGDASGVPLPKRGEAPTDYAARIMQFAADVAAVGLQHAKDAGLVKDRGDRPNE